MSVCLQREQQLFTVTENKDELTTCELLQYPNIPITYPCLDQVHKTLLQQVVENLLRPFSRFARLWHSLTVHIQPIWQHRSAALHLSKLACTLGCLLSHSDTHNNSPFCWRHSFCYLLLQCITRSAPGHKLTLTQPEHPWGITPQMPDLSIVTLFFSIHSKIFLFSKTFQQSFCNLWLGGSHKLSPKQRNELCSARLRKSLSSHLLHQAHFSCAGSQRWSLCALTLRKSQSEITSLKYTHRN